MPDRFEIGFRFFKLIHISNGRAEDYKLELLALQRSAYNV